MKFYVKINVYKITGIQYRPSHLVIDNVYGSTYHLFQTLLLMRESDFKYEICKFYREGLLNHNIAYGLID